MNDAEMPNHANINEIHIVWKRRTKLKYIIFKPVHDLMCLGAYFLTLSLRFIDFKIISYISAFPWLDQPSDDSSELNVSGCFESW